MGQNSSKGDKNTVAEYKPNFEVIRVIDDPNYGRVKLIRETKTHQQMILKEFIFDTKQAFEEELKFFKERAAFDHPHIVQVIGYNATQNQNLCSSLFKVSVFIEIISKELYTVLRERKRAKAAFSEGDLLIIAENVIQALYHLQTKNMAHGDIRPLNIFVAGQTYKITDPKLETDKNANALVKAIINNSETLLSPQLLAKIPTKKFEITEDKYKADVFSLGATLLNVATLKNSEELYDYQAGKLKEDLLRERLEEVKHQYSPFTYQLISDMLRINEQERPDFVDLRDRLLPHHEAINTKQDLPFTTHHQVETFGNVPAAVKQGGERAKKAAVLIPDEDRHDDRHHQEERLPSFASETHHTAAFGQPQRTEPVFHHHEDHYVPAAVTHHHEQHYVEPPQFKSNIDTDDLEAKIRAALQRSQNTYKQVQESEAHYGTHQPQTQVVSEFHSQRPLVSFGPSSDFVHTQQQQQNVPHTTYFEHTYDTHSFLPEHRVNAPRQPGYEEYMRQIDEEHRVKAPRQPGYEVEVSREVTGGEHRVMAPRQPGIEVEISRDVGGERRVMAPRQPGIEVEINRDVGGERRVMAPRQPGIEEQVKRSAVQNIDHDDVHVHAAQHHVEVPATRTSGFIHTEVPATRTSGFIHTSEPHAAPAKVEEYHHYVPSTTPATYEFSYTGNTYTPNTGYATQNLGLLESLKKTSEAALAHQQELQRQSETQNFGNTQPGSYQHESIHTYQPASYTTTSYNIGAPTSFGTTPVRTGDEHVVRSSPGVAATDDVRKVGEVGGTGAYNAAAFTYTSPGYGFNLPKAAADDVFAFTPQTYTVEHTAPQTTTTYNYTTGTLGQGYGHHEPASYTTTDYHFTTAAPGGYTAYGAGNDTKANGETEKILKSYHVEETPQIQNREASFSPTLPSVTPKHHVTNIQTTEFGRGDTVTYGTHTPTNAFPGADRPGGILGEVSSAVSKYTFTTVEEGGQNQLGDSPARFI